ncbi:MULTISPECIES: hypothetical protein [Methylobacterium]|uniref:hypothetical protein n=1 Tax=Methylobacterium TaxID=407 RepID=UPI0013ECEC8A|nr:hypothetical protein [Methylobacterium sp. DB0501]NGM32581.1 hypothetical protein [Methylobacterium sp. DB0501]
MSDNENGDASRPFISKNSSFNSYIDENPIISSGIIVAPSNSLIHIAPFTNAPDYKIYFKYRFSIEVKTQIHIATKDQNNVVLTLERNWTSLNTSAFSKDVVVASDDKHLYLMNLVFQAIGSEEKHTALLHYTIYSEALL